MKSETKIKICFFMIGAYPLFKKNKGSFGGAEINFYLLATKLAQNKNYEIDFFVGDFGQPDTEIIDGVNVCKVRFLNIKKFNGFYFKVMRRIHFFGAMLKSNADIYFTSTASEFALYMAVFAKLTGKLMFFRTSSEKDCNGFYIKNFGFRGKLFGYAIKLFDQIIAQNKMQQHMWQKYERKKSIVIENGLLIVDVPANIKKRYILWVARSIDLKQPGKFLEMARLIPDKDFLMILHGINSLSDSIKAEAEKIANLKIIDYVSFFEIQKYYNNALCFVNTSDMEGFPNTFIQACLGRTPILSLNVNPDDFITNNNLGAFVAGNMDSAVNFLINLDEKSVKKLGENAFAYVKAKHDLYEKVTLYDELFKAHIKKNKKN